MEDKYFAYYIPKNKTILMKNIKEMINDPNNIIEPHNTMNNIINNMDIIRDQMQKHIQVDVNINVNDWENFIAENINNNLNSLVLVKFILVNDLFINENDNNYIHIHNDYINTNRRTDLLRNKLTTYIHYNTVEKQKGIIFSGINHNEYDTNN